MTADQALAAAVAHHRARRLDEAEGLYRLALTLDPDNAGAHYLLGVIMAETGRPEQAVSSLEAAIRCRSDVAAYHAYLGATLQSLDRHEEALAAWVRTAELDPASTIAWMNIADLDSRLGRNEDAVRDYERVLEIQPDLVDAHCNIGGILRDLGRFDEAITHCLTALTVRPGYPQANYNLALCYKDLDQPGDAVPCYRQALADQIVLEIPRASLLTDLAVCLMALGQLDEAERHLREALDLALGHPASHRAMGNLLTTLGRYGEAGAHFRRAADSDPGNCNHLRAFLHGQLYDPAPTADERFAAETDFTRRHAAHHYPDHPWFANPRNPDRPLTIGYLSSDLGNHPVGRNLLPLLRHRDRSAFKTILYASMKSRDVITGIFKEIADGWREALLLDDDALAGMMREDGIDILVTLAGHFDINRPLVAARRPAPIQVSFHDPATSGMEVMDYLIADPVLAPRHGAERFTERPLRLPSFYLHDPITGIPAASPRPPMADNGFVTFGSCNNPAKLSDDTLALWAKVMANVPGSRLVLKYKTWFAAPAVAERIVGILATGGISGDRIELRGETTDFRSHLAVYDSFDIALDPFPFNGSTTTFEALWMGIPVVTLLGRTMVSRWAASILTPLGLSELVATSPSDYVEICRRLASDSGRLGAWRRGLRDHVASSPVCDGALRAKQMERLYRAMWRRWCHDLDR
jgi:protein O-GlcNAc transferase